uniref:Uncharacterized protein n=1 Tax=Romanomermis culicivorax TaxID=13658 RepID=A0A915KQR6_ROMCU
DAIKFPGKEGDIIYSKNNVCLHPNVVDGEPTHVPGYLTLHCQKDEVLGITLILQWLPNATLEKNPRSIRTMSPRFDQNSSPRSRVKLRALEGDQGKRRRRSSSGSSSSPPVLETSESATAEEASDEEKNSRNLSTVRVAVNDDPQEDEYSNNISLSTTTTAIRNTKSTAPSNQPCLSVLMQTYCKNALASTKTERSTEYQILMIMRNELHNNLKLILEQIGIKFS